MANVGDEETFRQKRLSKPKLAEAGDETGALPQFNVVAVLKLPCLLDGFLVAVAR
jgi:hypothetical protein